MNNLHRELAPISDSAWRDLSDQVRDAFVLDAGARRVVDMPEPEGPTLAAVGTGHLGDATVTDGVHVQVRTAQPVVELRAPFRVSRAAVDAVERGARDADWSPAIAAAQQLALAEDGAIFDGVPSTGATGLRGASPHGAITLPAKVDAVPTAVARARSVLRSAGVGGPYALLLSPNAYTAISGGVVEGYPAIEQLSRIVDGDVLWAPALDGGQLVSTRGGDYELVLGRDLSIGYQAHDAEWIDLYLEESFVFRVHTPEAAISLSPSGGTT